MFTLMDDFDGDDDNTVGSGGPSTTRGGDGCDGGGPVSWDESVRVLQNRAKLDLDLVMQREPDGSFIVAIE
jgi:hypothetical protein